MKKKIIYSSALAALLSASSIALAGGPEIIPVEDYFSGFYVGGTGSVHHVDFDASSNVDLITNIPADSATPFFIAGTVLSNDTDGASVDGYGGVQGGFGWTFNHVWYLGIQGFGDFGSQNSTQTSTTPFETSTVFPNQVPAVDVTTNESAITTTTKTSISNDYGVAAKLGYVVAPRTLVYGKIGASWANVTVDNSATSANELVSNSTILPFQVVTDTLLTGSSKTEQNKIGLLLGIGAEQFIYQDIVSLNIEYDYVNYGSVSTGPVQLTSTQTTLVNGTELPNNPVVVKAPLTTEATTSATVNSFLAGINFYFGRDWF